MDFNTETTTLAGTEHMIKNACLRILQIYYDIQNGININVGVFSAAKAKRPVLSINYNLNPNEEVYKKYLTGEGVKGKAFIQAMYEYLHAMPDLKNSTLEHDV